MKSSKDEKQQQLLNIKVVMKKANINKGSNKTTPMKRQQLPNQKMTKRYQEDKLDGE